MLHPALRKRESRIQGFGIFATDFIPKGTIIWTQGSSDRHFDYRAFLKLPPDLQRLCHVYFDGFVLSTDDAEVMNHSCDPNAACAGDEHLIALRDILPGEEVTYDYATSEIDPRVFAGWECACGAPNCRTVISVRDCLDAAFQQRYAGYLPNWTLTYIQRMQESGRVG